MPDVKAIEDDLAAFGLKPDAPIQVETLEVWDEHWDALRVASAMWTQMNVAGLGWVMGYRYEALPTVMRYVGVPSARRAEVFADLQVIEGRLVKLIRKRSE